MAVRKTVLIITLVLLFSGAPQASQEQCIELSKMAEVIMLSRQQGKRLDDLLVALSRTGEATADLYNAWAIDAFSQPLYHTSEGKQEAVTEFKNKALLDCLKSIQTE